MIKNSSINEFKKLSREKSMVIKKKNLLFLEIKLLKK